MSQLKSTLLFLLLFSGASCTKKRAIELEIAQARDSLMAIQKELESVEGAIKDSLAEPIPQMPDERELADWTVRVESLQRQRISIQSTVDRLQGTLEQSKIRVEVAQQVLNESESPEKQ